MLQTDETGAYSLYEMKRVPIHYKGLVPIHYKYLVRNLTCIIFCWALRHGTCEFQ